MATVTSTLQSLWAKSDRPGVRAFFLSMAALGIALFLALYSGAAAQLGNLFLASASALAALLVAAWVAVTLVPTLAKYLLKAKEHGSGGGFFTRFQRGFERGFESVRRSYHLLLTRFVLARRGFVPIFLLLCLSAFLLVPWLGQDFFPSTDGGNFILHVRGKTGLRIEETASPRLVSQR